MPLTWCDGFSFFFPLLFFPLLALSGDVFCSQSKLSIERGCALLIQPQDSLFVGFSCLLTASYVNAFKLKTHQVRTETTWVSGLLFHLPFFRSLGPKGDVCSRKARGLRLSWNTWLTCHQRPLQTKDQTRPAKHLIELHHFTNENQSHREWPAQSHVAN